MKQIRISAKLDKSGFQKELNQLLKKGYDLNLNLNGGNFKSVANDISKELNKLKNTLNNINGNTFNNASDGIRKTKDAVKDLNSELTRMSSKNLSSTSIMADKNGLSEINKYKDGVAQVTSEVIKNGQVTKQVVTENISQFNNLKNQLQNKLNVAKGNSFIDDSVLTNLQNRLNNISTNTPEKEFNELRNAINNLGSADSGIVRLQNAITRLQERISVIKKNKIDIVDPSDIAELRQAENEVSNLKNLLGQLKAGDVIDGKKISSSINAATSSVRTLENEFKNVNTAASGLATTMRNIFSYAFGGSAIYAAMNSMRAAVNTTIELDTAMRDLRRVSDETESTYNNFMQTANETAIALGTTTAGAIEATTTFKQLGYSFKESSEYMSQMAMILSNVGNMSASDAASSLVSILKGFRMEAEETTRIIDVLNEAGNRFALTTGDLTEGLRIGGASLAVANNDLEQASALIISGTEILKDSNLVANGLKTISMRLRGVSSDGEELNAKMGEFIKELTGVDLTDANGEFRSTYDVLKDIGEVWDTLESKEQAMLAEEIAGKTRANIFTSIMQNAEQLGKAYDALKDSAGSAEKEQEAYMDSLEGKINALKESLTGISMQMVNSDFLKGFVGGLTTGVNAIGGFIDTFGAMPTMVTTVVTAMTLFNNKFREQVNLITSSITPINNLQNKISSLGNYFVGLGEKYKSQISLMDTFKDTTKTSGNVVDGFGLQLLGLNAKLMATQVGLIATKVAAVALNAALSAGLSLLISSAISGLTKLADKMITTKDELKELNSEFASMTNVGGSDRLAYLINEYSNTQNAIKGMVEGTDEFSKAQDRLVSITEEVCSIFPEASIFIDAETGAKKLNLSETEKLIEAEKALYEAKANEVMSKNKINSVDDVKELADKYQEAIDKVNEYNDLTSSGAKSIYKGGQKTSLAGNLTKAREEAEEYKEQIESLLPALEQLEKSNPRLKGGYDLLREALYGVDEQLDNLKENVEDSSGLTNDLSNQLTDLNYDGVIDATDQMLKLAETTDKSKRAVDNLGDAFSQLEGPIGILEKAIEEFKEYGMVSDKTWSDIITSGNSEMIALLGDNNNFLKNAEQLYGNLKNQQEELAQQAIRRAQEEINASSQVVDATNNEIQATENLANAKNEVTSNSANERSGIEAQVVNNNARHYALDEANHNNKESYKIKGSFTSATDRMNAEKQVVDNNSKNYSIDSQNQANVENTKIKNTDTFASAAIQGVATMVTNNDKNYRTDANNFANATNSKLANIRALNDAVGASAGLLNEYKQLTAETKEASKVEQSILYGNNGANLKKPSVGVVSSSYVGSGGIGGGVSHGSLGSGSGGNKGSSSSSTSKEVEDMESLVDRYHDLEDAINDVNNELETNKILQDGATGKDKIALMEKEIQLYKKQQQAVKDLIVEQKKEAEELKKSLSSQGVKFDSKGDISNYNEILKSKVNWANSLSGDAKENAIEQVKALEEAMKSYDELVNKSIPKQEQEWESLNNTIKDVYKTQAELIADVEKNISETIEYELKKRYDAKKEALNKEKELYNKEYEEANFEEEMNIERNKLAEIQAEIDKVKNDTSRQGQLRLKQLLADYENQQKVINDKIKEQQNQAINDRFDAEEELLDKQLEDMTSTENLSQMVADAISTGMIKIGDETISVKNSMNDMLKETEVGFANVALQQSEWLDNLEQIKTLYSSISSIMTNAGMTMPSYDNISRSRSMGGINITTGGITITGNADSSTLGSIQDMLDAQAKEIYKNIAKQLS